MSIEYITWAFKAEMPSGRKFVLIALCDMANGAEGGLCYPNIATVATHCGMSRRAVEMHLQALETSGYLRTYRQLGKKSRYQLNLVKLQANYSSCVDVKQTCEESAQVDDDTEVVPPAQILRTSPARTAHLPAKELRTTYADSAHITGKEPEEEPESNRNGMHAQGLHCIPGDFQPDESGKLFAQQLGLDWQREAGAFRDYFREQDIQTTDWQAHWKSWCCDSAQTA